LEPIVNVGLFQEEHSLYPSYLFKAASPLTSV